MASMIRDVAGEEIAVFGKTRKVGMELGSQLLKMVAEGGSGANCSGAAREITVYVECGMGIIS